jgi:DNA-binding MarR family transcriptional regulator
MIEESVNAANELQLLEALEESPETTQADLAAQLGVAVGTVNWYLKRWSKKGYVKISRINRWKWRYLLTTEGIARKARLASEYVEASMRLYRLTRESAKTLLKEVRNAGYNQVRIVGEGEIAEICRLTCIERGIEVIHTDDPLLPSLQIEGTKLLLVWPTSPEEDPTNV